MGIRQSYLRRLLLFAGLGWTARVRAQPAIAPSLMDFAAHTLARLVETARRQAIAAGVRPMPASVYRGLLGFFPDALLRHVRFASGWRGTLSLPAFAFTYGDAAAVTVGEVILFRDERAAQRDLALWAHELTHVMQYQRWGIDGFASRYVRDSDGVESEAISNAGRFTRWLPSARARGTR
ncbi:MAG TPA: DUF4157 domain-containing protein [Acetobacteraceae bacterium]|jgi:hypothetical protein